MTDRIDPAAYRAAYNALAEYVPHAQIRDHVAEMVVRAVTKQRTLRGLNYMAELAARRVADDRMHITHPIMADIPETATTVTERAVDAAVRAAAKALHDGTEGSPYRPETTATINWPERRRT